MRLMEVDLELSLVEVPPDVAKLLAAGRESVEALENETSLPAFVPSDFQLVYRGLAAIAAARLSTGQRFVEWGSGLGVITCLASLTGFDAVGIEIEPPLVEMAQKLAMNHGVPVQFACGSFIPRRAMSRLDWSADIAWLSTDGPDAYAALELEVDDFDVVFAYPWPGEEQVIFDLFAESAAVGGLLLTYHGLEGLRLQRKVRR
jgi:hypothetical protein